ncbi:hypothetical protein ACEQ8H_006562 [Pleosporales sp. CAS-2024a]
MAWQIYVYEPIQRHAEIRVLVLEPAKAYSAELLVSLEHVQISSRRQDGSRAIQEVPSARSSVISLPQTAHVQYESVSYAWGDQQPTERLAMKGTSPRRFVMIRPNVDVMLRSLRSARNQRRLWIDALCINQGDIEEKGIQVQFMEEVYRQAKCILVWLGIPEDASAAEQAATKEVQSNPLRLLVDFSTAECTDDRDRMFALNAVSTVQAFVSYTETAESIYVAYAEKLIRWGYFAVLNSAGATKCDRSELPSWVPDWRRPLIYNPVTTQSVPRSRGDDDDQAIFRPNMDPINRLLALNATGIKLGTVVRLGIGARMPVWNADVLSIILAWFQLLQSGPHARATNPGSRCDVFVSTITLGTIVQRTNNLSPDHPWLRDKHPDYETDVSWLVAYLISADQKRGHALASEQQAQTTIGDAQDKARDITMIETAASKLPEEFRNAFKNLMLINKVNRHMAIDIQNDINLIWSFKEPLTNEAWYDRNLEPNEVLDIITRTIAGRTCFWTRDGAFGIGPAAMQSGDVVVAFPSCNTPYILRPKASGVADTTSSPAS